jgi:hypothetical protein
MHQRDRFKVCNQGKLTFLQKFQQQIVDLISHQGSCLSGNQQLEKLNAALTGLYTLHRPTDLPLV